MSNVEAVNEAKEEAKRARYSADYRISKNEEEKSKAIWKAEQEADAFKKKADLSRRAQFISYSILGIFLLMASTVHYEVWKDLSQFFFIPIKGALSNWIIYFQNEPKVPGAERWFCLIGIPVTLIGGVWFIGFMITLLKKRWCLLTFTAVLINAGATIILGDYLPFNRFIMSLGLLALYHVAYAYARKKSRSIYAWENFRDNLIIKDTY